MNVKSDFCSFFFDAVPFPKVKSRWNILVESQQKEEAMLGVTVKAKRNKLSPKAFRFLQLS